MDSNESLESWVQYKIQDWRDHFEANHSEQFDEYYRLWRGIWAVEDRTRESERSRIISPALQQAVESSVAEIEEATFGRGSWFDIRDNHGDKDPKDVQFIRHKLHEDFQKRSVRRSVGECLINSAVFGTGIAEVSMGMTKEHVPAQEPLMGGQLVATGVNIKDRMVVDMRPIMPKQFLIDPVATSIQDAMGCAIDEFVSAHHVTRLQEEGVYFDDVEVGSAPPDFDIEPDDDLTVYHDDKVRITKYFGLVPRDLLSEITDAGEGDSQYVEAIVVLANEGVLLKAEANPYMMGDRPIVAFQWDIVPGRFWGRGVCEKGYNSQKALDTEIRARIDALALTTHPMMAMDATRMPRGHKPEIRPGKIILTNGPPQETLHPFNFGQVSQITFAQAGELQKMVQMATGAIDSAGIAGSINGEATAAGISMSLGAIIKRHKRTLVNFQESFLIPFVEKAAWRYMQFDPEEYPARDYKFTVTSSLGIMAREYAVSQLVQLLQTISPDSPLYLPLMRETIENMSLADREGLIGALEKSAQPSPEAQQAQKAEQERLQQAHAAQIGVFRGQEAESMARAKKYTTEAQMEPMKLEIQKLEAITTNIKDGDKDDIEFERRLKIADRALKEKEINLKEKAMQHQQASSAESSKVDRELMRRLGIES